MVKNKTLIFIIVLLFLTNLGLLTYLFIKEKNYQLVKEKSGFMYALKKKVNFNDNQFQQFNLVKKTYWTNAVNGLNQIVKIKTDIFELIRQGHSSDSAIIYLADSIGKLRSNVEMNLYYNTKKIRAICTPQQLPAYDSLIMDVIRKQEKVLKFDKKQ